MSRQDSWKHLLNEQMNTRMETVDAYMQIIPAGSRSGRHRHLARSACTWWKARLRPAPGLRSGNHRHLSLEASSRGEALRWEAGRDLHSTEHESPSISTRTPEKPVRLISAINRTTSPHRRRGRTLGRLDLQTRPEYDPSSCMRSNGSHQRRSSASALKCWWIVFRGNVDHVPRLPLVGFTSA